MNKNIFTLCILFISHVFIFAESTPLVSKVPDDALAYIRFPNPINLISKPKGSVLNDALSHEALSQHFESILENLDKKFLAPLPQNTGVLPSILLKSLKSPLEAILFMPPGMPIPNVYLSATLDIHSHKEFSKFLNALQSLPNSPIKISKELSEKGEATLLLAGQFPAFLRFNFSTGVLEVFGGMMASPEAFAQVRAKLKPRTDSELIRQQKNVDSSNEGLWIWLNTKAILPLAMMTMPPHKKEILKKSGLQNMKSASLGWGVVNEKAKLVLQVESPSLGWLAFLPEVKNSLKVKSSGEPHWASLVSVPLLSVYESLKKSEETGIKKNLAEAEEQVKKAGFSLEQILRATQGSFVFFGDDAGDYMSFELADPKDFQVLLKKVVEKFNLSHVTYLRKGKTYHHLSFNLSAFQSKEIKMMMGANPLLGAMNTHLYWIEEGSSLVFGQVPQALYDRADLGTDTSVSAWLKKNQKQNPENALLLFSAKMDQLPRRIYYTYIAMMTMLSDITGSVSKVVEFPNAVALSLPKKGSYGLQLNHSGEHTSLEWTFENSPVDFLLDPNQSLSTIAVIGLGTTMLMPALQGTRFKANQTVSKSNISSMVKNLLMNEDDSKSRYSKKYNHLFKTISNNFQEGAYLKDGEVVLEKDADSTLLEVLFALKGKHPFGGYYALACFDPSGKGKTKFDFKARIVLEVGGPDTISIGFSDGHVTDFPFTQGELSDAEIIKILSVKGEESLMGD